MARPTQHRSESSLAPLFVADNGSGDGQASLAATGLTSAPAQGNAAPAAASASIESKPAAEASPRDAAAPANAAEGVTGSSSLPEVAGLSAAVKAPTPAPTAATLAPKADPAKPGVTASAPAAIGPAAAAPEAARRDPAPGNDNCAHSSTSTRAWKARGRPSRSTFARGPRHQCWLADQECVRQPSCHRGQWRSVDRYATGCGVPAGCRERHDGANDANPGA